MPGILLFFSLSNFTSALILIAISDSAVANLIGAANVIIGALTTYAALRTLHERDKDARPEDSPKAP